MVSTRGRYALRFMIDLAEHNTGEYITLKDITDRQDMSEKYLESISKTLSQAGLIDGHRGKGGGYRLNRPADKYTVEEILELTDGTLSPVQCLATDVNTCPRASECQTLPLWTNLEKVIRDYLGSVKLSDLIKVDGAGDNYSI